jgi:hypothetical protein
MQTNPTFDLLFGAGNISGHADVAHAEQALREMLTSAGADSAQVDRIVTSWRPMIDSSTSKCAEPASADAVITTIATTTGTEDTEQARNKSSDAPARIDGTFQPSELMGDQWKEPEYAEQVIADAMVVTNGASPANHVRIDPEFQGLIPPLAPEELQQLEDNLRCDGCRDSLVVWNDILVNGHHRFEICSRLKIPFETRPIEFSSRIEAADWIDANQLGRRNLTPDLMSLLRGRRYNRAKNSHGGDRRSDIDSSDQSDPLKTAERLAGQHKVSPATIKRDGRFADAIEKLEGVIPDIKSRVMKGQTPPRKVVIRIAKNPETAVEELANVRARQNSPSDEWYTPAPYVDAARRVLGSIKLDPATTPEANEVINAVGICTAKGDGLTHSWTGTVFLNPPHNLTAAFCEKLLDHFKAGDVPAAIAFVKNSTETEWFQSVAKNASAVCFIANRVDFYGPEKDREGALQGHVAVYLGKHADKFRASFKKFGVVVQVCK